MSSAEPTSPPHPQRSASWSRYWSSGALHSCTSSFRGNYDGNVERFWSRQFLRLGQGDRVLDIGTGNGALPLLLMRSASALDQGVQCDAIDLASIRPPDLVPELAVLRERVRFHPETSVEHLPFPDASFALATAQYALEYTDPARSIPELARVLRPGGRLALLAHHAGSLLLRVAGEELGHCARLLDGEGMLACARRLLPFLALAATAEGVERLRRDPNAEAARAAFNRSAQAVIEARDQTTVPDLLHAIPDRIALALRELPRVGAEAATAMLDALAQELSDATVRLDELQRFALDASGIERWSGALRRAGIEPERIEPLQHEDGALMAWAIEARRA